MDITFTNIMIGKFTDDEQSYISYGLIVDGRYTPKFIYVPDDELKDICADGDDGIVQYLYDREFEIVQEKEAKLI